MTKADVERGYEILKELDRIKERVDTLDDLIGHEQRKCIEEGKTRGEIEYNTYCRIESPRGIIYPEGARLTFETISVVELLKTEKVRLSCEMRRLEEELEAL